jgi:hypothetical protein
MALGDLRKSQEEQWFLSEEKKLLEKMRRERGKRIQEEEKKKEAKEREKLKELHWMCCPKCGHPMKEEDLYTIKVDVCTLCEGIYFDRGELEDLMLAHQSQSRKSFFRRLLGFGRK